MKSLLKIKKVRLSGVKAKNRLNNPSKVNKSKKSSKKIRVGANTVPTLLRDDTHNCMFCSLFHTCKDINKSTSYICNKFNKYKIEAMPKLTILNIDKQPKDLIKEENRDFESAIEKALSSLKSSPLPPDMRVDDSDLPAAKNSFEFITGKKFLDQPAFAKQLEVALHAYADYCPRCSDLDYVFDIPKKHSPDKILERVKLLHNGKCPKCKGNRSEFYKSGELKVPVETNVLAGQRSGKSSLSHMMHAYTIHQYLKLQNAPKVFGLLDGTMLFGQYTAQTFYKAKELLYDGIFIFLSTSPWFKEYNKLMRHYENKYGEEIVILNPTFTTYRLRRLTVLPRTPDKTILRGNTSFSGGIDELSLFNSDDKSASKLKVSGKETYTSLKNSFKTLRPAYYNKLKKGQYALPPPMYINISSPMSKKDTMVQINELAERSNYIVGFRYATWEFNPTMSRRSFDDEFAVNPTGAMRDFGAVPPNSSSPYIVDIENTGAIIDRDLRNKVKVSLKTIISQSGSEMLGADVKFLAPKDSAKRIMAIDAASNNNSFAMVCGYVDEETSLPIFDTFIELQPTVDNPINFNSVFEDIICPIIERMNVAILVADRWNSLKLLHDAEAFNEGLLAEQYSVKYSDFASLRYDIFDGNITVPRNEIKIEKIDAIGENDYPNGFVNSPIAHFLYQLVTVKDLGKEVIKGDNTTDDILRALVLAYSYMTDPDYAELCTGSVDVAGPTNRIFGTVGSRNMGGMGGGAGVSSGSSTSSGNVGLIVSRGGFK